MFQPDTLPRQRGELEAFLKLPENDLGVRHWVDGLRARAEGWLGWHELSERARSELQELPDRFLGSMLGAAEEYLLHLPAGHGIGHLSRDKLHAGVLMADPEVHQLVPEPEIVAGLVAGVFHDVGNAVTERYADLENYSAHGDRGAVVFDVLTRDVLSTAPALRTMIELVIAGHTHYTADLVIVKPGMPKVVIHPYDTAPVLVDGKWGRMAHPLARACDRADTIGFVHIIRHILTKVVPTRDFDAVRQEAVKPTGTEEQDFLHHFNPRLRRPEVIAAAEGIEKARGVLEHLMMFADNATNLSVYNQYDFPLYREQLVLPRVDALRIFVMRVIAEPQGHPKEEQERALEDFCRLCLQIEPAQDTERALQTLRNKWQLLPEAQRDQWTNGLLWLTSEGHTIWYRDFRAMLGMLRWPSQVGASSLNPAIARMAAELEERAVPILTAFAPGRDPLNNRALAERISQTRYESLV